MIIKKINKKFRYFEKNGRFKGITPKSLKEASDICSPILCDALAEEIIRKRTFSKDNKNADVTPVFKRDPSFS